MEPVAEIPFEEIIYYDKFTFDEETERPDELRFFTLEDQLQDYMNQRLPRRMPTSYELRKLEAEVDRFKMLYLKYIELQQSTYILKDVTEKRHPSWVHPLFDTFEYREFDMSRWMSLFSPQSIREKNFYRDMIQALPQPFTTVSNGESIPIEADTVGYIENADAAPTQIRALGKFKQTRTMFHEDGTFDIVLVNAPNVSDDNLRRKGFMFERPFELQQPLGDNHFLGSESKGSFDTPLSLDEEYPSIQAILTYGIPKSQDPYSKEIKRYMKLWDIRLNEIPYSLWKAHFHPADPVPALDETTIKRIEPPNTINPPIHVIPFAKLLFEMKQPNLSPLVVEHLERQLPESTPEECFHTDSYERFRESGVYRIVKSKGVCVPPEIIHKERREALVKGKIPWDDATRDIIENKIRETSNIIVGSTAHIGKIPVYQEITQNVSKLRKEVLLIYNDEHRTDEDKLNDIGNRLLKDIIPTKHVYYDDNNAFVFCEHSLAILKGDLKEDANTFQREWTAVNEGRYMCKFCGETIGTQFVNVSEYDSEGYVVNQARPLETVKYIKHQETGVRTLDELQTLFELRSNMYHAILYLILSVLDISPPPNQLIKILDNGKKAQQAFYKKKPTDLQKLVQSGALAISASIILIQANLLTPKRRFKGKRLLMTGFPRDDTDFNKPGILDSILQVLETTLYDIGDTAIGLVKEFQLKFKSNRSDIRQQAVMLLKFFTGSITQFKTEIEEAKLRVKIEDEEIPAVVFPNVHIEKLTYSVNEGMPRTSEKYRCKATRPKLVLESTQPAILTAVPLKPYAKIEQIHFKPINVEELSISPEVVEIDESIIRKRIALGFPKVIKFGRLQSYLEESKDGYGIMSLLSRVAGYKPELLKIGSKYIDEITSINLIDIDDEFLIADIGRGMFYEFLHTVSKASNAELLRDQILSCITNDMVARGCMEDIGQALKVEQLLRAQERLTLVERNRMIESDEERSLMKQLLDLGLINGIITNKDRQMFADNLRLQQLDAGLGEDDVDVRTGVVGGDGENHVDANGREALNEGGDYGMHPQEQYEDNDRNEASRFAVLV